MKTESILAVLASTVLAVPYGQAAIIAHQDFEGNPASPGLSYTTSGTTVINTGIVTGGTPNTST